MILYLSIPIRSVKSGKIPAFILLNCCSTKKSIDNI